MLVCRQLGNAFLRQRNQFAQFVQAERRTFRRALDFDDFARSGHNDVDIAVAAGVFGLIQIQKRHTVHHACGYGGNGFADGIFADEVV